MKKDFLENPAYLSTNKHKIRQFHEFGEKTYNLKQHLSILILNQQNQST